MKKENETPHTRGNIGNRKPSGKQDPNSDEQQVAEITDDMVYWDPVKQKWVSLLSIIVNSPDAHKTYSYSRETDEFPKDMDVPNTTSSPVVVDVNSQDDLLFYGDMIDDQTGAGEFKDPKSHEDGLQLTSVVTTGYALGTQLIKEAKNPIYDWKSETYMLTTPGNKPITPVFDGAIVSGAQLNAATGTNDYNTGALYEVRSVTYESWQSASGWRDDDPIFSSVNYFINRNKGNGKAEWTPGTVAITLEAEVISSESVSRTLEGHYLPKEEEGALIAAGLDPHDWEVTGTQQEEIKEHELFDNPSDEPGIPDIPIDLPEVPSQESDTEKDPLGFNPFDPIKPSFPEIQI